MPEHDGVSYKIEPRCEVCGGDLIGSEGFKPNSILADIVDGRMIHTHASCLLTPPEDDVVTGTVHGENCEICNKALMYGPRPVRVAIRTENMIPMFSHLECMEKTLADPSDMQESFLNEFEAIEAENCLSELQRIEEHIQSILSCAWSAAETWKEYNSELLDLRSGLRDLWMEALASKLNNLEEKINVWREKH